MSSGGIPLTAEQATRLAQTQFYSQLPTPPKLPGLIPAFVDRVRGQRSLANESRDRIATAWEVIPDEFPLKGAEPPLDVSVMPSILEVPSKPRDRVQSSVVAALEQGGGPGPTNMFEGLREWMAEHSDKNANPSALLEFMTFEEFPMTRRYANADAAIPSGPSLVDPRLGRFVCGLKTMLEHKYEPTRSVKSTLLDGALNYPFITGINGILADPKRFPQEGGRILVVGTKGYDYFRIVEGIRRSGRPIVLGAVDTVEPDERNYESAFHEFERLQRSGTFTAGVPSFATFKQFCALMMRPVPYDLILFGYSLPQALNGEMPEVWFPAALAKLLKPTGTALCTHMDPGGVELLSSPDGNAQSRCVTLLNQIPPSPRYPNGANVVRVASTVFVDPCLPVARLADALSYHGLIWDQVPGREMYSRYGHTVGGDIRGAAKLNEGRAVVCVEIRHLNDTQPLACVWAPRKGAELVLRPVGAEESVPPELRFEFPKPAKGRPLAFDDVPFLRAAPYMISLKYDGVSAVIRGLTGSKRLYVELAGRDMYYVELALALPVDFVAHAEFMQEDFREPRYVAGPGDKPSLVGELVVVDPYRFGDCPTQSFLARLHAARAWLRNPELAFLGMKMWEHLTAEAFESVLALYNASGLADGIVFQETFARPGTFENELGRFGSAHFFKSWPTIDVTVRGGRIVEPWLQPELGLVTYAPDFLKGLAAVADGCYEVTCTQVTRAHHAKLQPLQMLRLGRTRMDRISGNSEEEVRTMMRVMRLEELQEVLAYRVNRRVVQVLTLAPKLWNLAAGAPTAGAIPADYEREFKLLGLSYGMPLLFDGIPAAPDAAISSILVARYVSFLSQWYDAATVAVAARDVVEQLGGSMDSELAVGFVDTPSSHPSSAVASSANVAS